MKRLFLIFLLFTFYFSWCQIEIDSLKKLVLSTSLQGKHRVDVLNQLAHLTRFTSIDQSMAYADEAALLAGKIKYKEGECDAEVTKGLNFWLSTYPEKGLEVGLHALQISDSIQYKNGQMEANLLLGLVYKDYADSQKAEDFTKTGLSLALELKNNVGIARAYNALGNYSRIKGEADKSIEFFQTALRYLASDDIETLLVKPVVLGNISGHYRRQGDRLKARQYLEDALKICLVTKGKINELSTRIRIGELFLDANNYQKAEEQFLMCEKMGLEFGSGDALLQVYVYLILCKSKLGLEEEANQFRDKHSKLKDELYDLRRARQIAQIENKYELEKKEQTIKLLQQERQIQNMWRNVLIGGVLLISIFSYLVFILQRSRTRKTKELLNVQQELNEKLKEVDKFKSNFFASLSHEFRTPLTLILGPVDVELKKRAGSESESLHLIKRNANRLLELVNQMLDMSRLEAGKMELYLKQENPEQFLKTITSSFDAWASQKNIKFSQNIKLDNDALWYDGDKVEKIVTNLLTNAFKFTPVDGEIGFVAKNYKVDDRNWLSITVSDTGSGIPNDEQEKIFLPFYQNKQIYKPHGQEGSGLGLSIVRELIKLYKGTIKLQSTEGQGTSISVDLPADRELLST